MDLPEFFLYSEDIILDLAAGSIGVVFFPLSDIPSSGFSIDTNTSPMIHDGAQRTLLFTFLVIHSAFEIIIDDTALYIQHAL